MSYCEISNYVSQYRVRRKGLTEQLKIDVLLLRLHCLCVTHFGDIASNSVKHMHLNPSTLSPCIHKCGNYAVERTPWMIHFNIINRYPVKCQCNAKRPHFILHLWYSWPPLLISWHLFYGPFVGRCIGRLCQFAGISHIAVHFIPAGMQYLMLKFCMI